MQKVSFQALFRNANPDALDLLDKMLAFDPSQRISVETALEHRYLHIWHDASDEPVCPQTFDFHFEVVDDIGQMKKMILDEVQRFRHVVRQQPGTQMQQGMMAQNPASNVPIPENFDRMAQEYPRPQEAQAAPGGLEGELHQGMDFQRQ